MSRRGAVLLEVMAALTIFAFAALSSLALLEQLHAAELAGEARERVAADQDRLMTAYALLPREDLDRRLGARSVGPHLVEVQRPEPRLYRVSISDSAGPRLVTLLYRPEPRRETP